MLHVLDQADFDSAHRHAHRFQHLVRFGVASAGQPEAAAVVALHPARRRDHRDVQRVRHDYPHDSYYELRRGLTQLPHAE